MLLTVGPGLGVDPKIMFSARKTLSLTDISVLRKGYLHKLLLILTSFNLRSLYIHKYVATVSLYLVIQGVEGCDFCPY